MADETVVETSQPETEASASGVSNAPTDWRAALSPELQTNPTLAPYKTLEDALRGGIEARKLVGDTARIPKPDAKPEEWARFHRALGVPETADKYELPPAPKGEAWSPEELSNFRTLAHQHGLTQKQLHGLLGWFTEYSLKQRDVVVAREARQAQETREQAIKALEAKWGAKDGPDWKHNQARAEQAVRVLMADAPQDAIQRVVESANDPEVAHAFSILADSLLERGYIGEDDAPSGLGSEAAQAKADEIADAARKDTSHPLRNEAHPDHQRVLKQYMDYLAAAVGPRGREIVTTVMR